MKLRVLVFSLCCLSSAIACDEVKTSDSCGDGFLDPGEVCDRSEFLFASCADYGYYEQHGELACAADCSLGDGVCVGRCGDGEVQMDHGEECEGTDLNGSSCVGLGYSGGPLACDAACRYDVSGCVSSCGNGILDTGEDCDDGGRADGDGCDRLCALEPGWACTGIPSECATECGDGIAAGDEECDGVDLRGVTCDSLGHWFGELGCDSSCALAKHACLDVVQIAAGEEHTCALLTDRKSVV